MASRCCFTPIAIRDVTLKNRVVVRADAPIFGGEGLCRPTGT